MKNPYLTLPDLCYSIYSTDQTEYVSYTVPKNPYLRHGWATDAISKLKQKAYNNKYYTKNKELWKTKYYKYEKKAKQTLSDVKDSLSSTSSKISGTVKKYSSNALSGPGHDLVNKSESTPHIYKPVEKAIVNGIKYYTPLTRKAVNGSVQIVLGSYATAVGVATLNPLFVAGGLYTASLGAAKIVSAGQRVTEAIQAENRYKEIEAHKKTEKYDPKSGFYLKDKEYSAEEDVKLVNAKFRNLDSGSKNNCMLCSVTYELRRRGYDVTANQADDGYYLSDIQRWFPDAEPQIIETGPFQSDEFRKQCLAQGEGASGLLLVSWKQGGGHAMHYRVEGGKVIVSDGQTGKIYGDISSIASLVSEISYCRLDDKEPDYEALKEVCK